MSRQARLLIYTGAGISVPSGLPAFRGQTGLWNDHRIEDVCDAMAWYRNPEGIHRFYNELRVKLGEVKPSSGHLFVAELQDRYRATVLTSNIDDLHERAAESEILDDARIVHLHGHLWKMTCTQCREPWDIGYRAWDRTCERCPGCGTRKLVRPDVVFFREPAPAYRHLHSALDRLTAADVLLVIGTSSAVVEIGSLAAKSDAHTILCNLTAEPDLVGTAERPNFDDVILGPIEDSIELLRECLKALL